MAVSPSPDITARAEASVEAWKRRLLDLSLRNRALNLKTGGPGALACEGPDPVQALRHLVLDEQRYGFFATRTTEGTEEDPEVAPGVREASLAVAMTRHALDGALRRLDDAAARAREDQGLGILFLCLGQVRWVDPRQPGTPLLAPLLLLPVTLARRAAGGSYHLEASQEDPIVNPTLAEALRHHHRIELPALPDDLDPPDEQQPDPLAAWFDDVTREIGRMDRGAIEHRVVLTTLSFAKYVMYRDLDVLAPGLAAHPLAGRLFQRKVDEMVGLPASIRDLDLDRDHPPESTPQIVDADGSQLRAVAAVSRGHDLVLEGPPGTGKSQTITNLIASVLARGGRVLFVAEKKAALDVVHAKLAAAGLGECCLELHAAKATRRAVLASIGEALDRSLAHVTPPSASGPVLKDSRARLAAYLGALHRTTPEDGLSARMWMDRLEPVRQAPRCTLEGTPAAWTEALWREAIRALEALGQTGTALGHPADHPWRGSCLTLLTEDRTARIDEAAGLLRQALGTARDAAIAVAARYGLPPLRKLSDLAMAAGLGDMLAEAPGLPMLDEAWQAPPPAASAALEALRTLGNRRKAIAPWAEGRWDACTAPAREALSADLAHVRAARQRFWGLGALLDGRVRHLRRHWANPGDKLSVAETEQRLADLLAWRDAAAAVEAMGAEGQRVFGGLWRGTATDAEALGQAMDWMVTFRALCVRHQLSREPLARVAGQRHPEVSDLRALRQRLEALRTALRALEEAVAWPEGWLANEDLEEAERRVEALQARLADGPRWTAWEGARQQVLATEGRRILTAVDEGRIPPAQAAAAFQRAAAVERLDALVAGNPVLASFNGPVHEQDIDTFRKLDQQVLQDNRLDLVAGHRHRLQEAFRQPDLQAELQILRREVNRLRAHRPLRETMRKAGRAIRTIKPCLLMSPLTVAQFLPPDIEPFDLVVFDEASQLPTQDAIGAIARGRQLVVVGDPRQLPPTNFFQIALDEEVPRDEDGEPLLETTESVLEEFMSAGIPFCRLKWHYRSQHPSLIQYSNVQCYDGELLTPPSPLPRSEALGLAFHHVADGVYEGQGRNPREARVVAEAVMAHFRRHPELSLGVGTFNQAQQQLILDEVDRLRRQEPDLEPLFTRDRPEPFFVKHLETIQGDERDVILISVSYGRNSQGRIHQLFGPLNQDQGWRRLNVLASRARKRMAVYASILAEDLRLGPAQSDGPRLLRTFLHFAQTGHLDLPGGHADALPENPFEAGVRGELERLGHEVVSQVGVAGFRIDLAVMDPNRPGRFLCGIECDGASYHSSPTARDRDRLRQQLLEARGWTILRVWSTDWFKDRSGEVARLDARLRELARQVQPVPVAESEHTHAAESVVAAPEPTTPAPVTAPVGTDARERPYRRPVLTPYMAVAELTPAPGGELTEAPLELLARHLRQIAAVEAPIHVDELAARLVAIWQRRQGSRIRAHLDRALAVLLREGGLVRRGDFIHREEGRVVARRRTDVALKADRIAPEEYGAALLAVLADGHGFDRDRLLGEVRGVLGFSRTGPQLESAIEAAMQDLLAKGVLGQGSAGVALREGQGG
ncbi:MAG: DUF3320 domain-containing protein [Candidatus Sericytochromatia bacterium]|nr:DUF3320 domain-containing protein [Candidatus Sericytochromatia bacterium]